MTNGALSTTRLRRLREVLGHHVDQGHASGLVWVVARRDESHVEAIGSPDTAGAVALGRDAIFRVASMTKPVTAVATLLLVEECVLRLDEPVQRWVPELADPRVVRRIDAEPDDTVPAERPITVRDLLTFRLGSGHYFGPCPVLEEAGRLGLGMGPPQPAAAPEPDEWLRRFSTLPLLCQPGERWLYHTGAELLGVLVARAAGQPFEAFLRERVFEPLGMRDTGFFVPEASRRRLVTSYATDPATGGLRPYDEPDGQWSTPPAFPSGGGGLVSTADDYLAFAQMLLSAGFPLLSRPSVETMTTDQLTAEQKSRSGFFPGDFDARGFGFCVGVTTRREHPSAPVGQYGWDGGLGTVWRNDPAEQMITILMTNGAFGSPRPPDVIADFLTAAYAAIDD
jgi:CubicO group peptidase (beta-lactamase class C family)